MIYKPDWVYDVIPPLIMVLLIASFTIPAILLVLDSFEEQNKSPTPGEVPYEHKFHIKRNNFDTEVIDALRKELQLAGCPNVYQFTLNVGKGERTDYDLDFTCPNVSSRQASDIAKKIPDVEYVGLY